MISRARAALVVVEAGRLRRFLGVFGYAGDLDGALDVRQLQPQFARCRANPALVTSSAFRN